MTDPHQPQPESGEAALEEEPGISLEELEQHISAAETLHRDLNERLKETAQA